MDVSEIITELNNHGFEDTTEEQKLLVINDTLWDIEARKEWPWAIKSVALNTDGSSPTPTNMPADFKSVKWIYDTIDGRSVWWERLDTVRDRWGNQMSRVETPFVYYFLGETLRFFPTPPAAAGRYQMDYFAFQTEVNAATLEAAILLPKRHHRVIVLGTVAKLYLLEDDAELAANFNNMYEQRIQTMAHDLIKKQFQNPDQIFVIDEDDEFYLPNTF